MRVTFRPDLDTGLDYLDQQHHALYAQADALLEALLRGGLAEIEPLLDEVGQRFASHFRCEEDLMRCLEYPEVGSHKREHEDLLVRWTELREGLHGRGGLELVQPFAAWFGDWMDGHLRTAEAAFGRWVRASPRTAECAARLCGERGA